MSDEQTPETDWERFDAMTDAEIDTSDIPPLDDAWFARAVIRYPKGWPTAAQTDPAEPITVPVDSGCTNR